MNNFFILSKNQINRIKKNLLAKLTSESSQIVTQVLYPPLMILFWGLEQFGIWLFLISLTSMFSMLNFNFTDASLQEMSIYNNQKKYNKVNEIFQNTLGLIIINLLILSLIIFIYLFFFEISFLIIEGLN
jgi:O-antigen/teichoic acid export membrane protein